MKLPALLLISAGRSFASAFVLLQPRTNTGATKCGMRLNKSGDCDDDDWSIATSKRRDLLKGVTSAMAASLFMFSTSATEPAYAKDELYKKNPLTNQLLEKVRIWEQAEADDLKYGGELERGDAEKIQANAYGRLLVPILEIAKELNTVKDLAQQTASAESGDSVAVLKQLLAVLNQSKYDKISFKKVFNAFSDNIYYSDPDRANMYLGGGAIPKASQSIAYMLRNDMLTNIEDMRAESIYILKNQATSTEDLIQLATVAVSAMTEYLAVVPPNEIEQANSIMAAAAAAAASPSS